MFGARVNMETNLFGRLRNVGVVRPSPADIDLTANAYVRIVEDEHASQQDYGNLRDLAHTLIQRERLDAILLAGTDLSLVFNPNNTDFPHLDGARVHIDVIIRRLVSGALDVPGFTNQDRGMVTQ
jgi:aspartate racemase